MHPDVSKEEFLQALRDGISQGIHSLLYNPAFPTSELMMRAIQRGVADGIARASEQTPSKE